jgi:hypothetical protein
MYEHCSFRGRPYNTERSKGEEGGQRFVTKPCENIGICTDLRYERRGSKISVNRVTYYMDDPLDFCVCV